MNSNIEKKRARFWSKVNKKNPQDCWEWKAGLTKNGYGAFYLGGRNHLASRVAWILTYGPIPRGKCVCHHCDNPPCVNPSHLFVGTRAENSADMVRKRRNPRGAKKPLAKLTEKKIRLIRDDPRPQRAIAKDFGVCQASIHRIKARKNWPHVE